MTIFDAIRHPVPTGRINSQWIRDLPQHFLLEYNLHPQRKLCSTIEDRRNLLRKIILEYDIDSLS